ncbi:unnamed protein product [Owenia fusiformis]|uniref:Uncharacterized protein n=1 Tax=Owenia fusiformis TaxID=6347 RepID=A0A8J1UZF8_OWEFU|nr:unnamed protein product [Owenia fusiformis]
MERYIVFGVIYMITTSVNGWYIQNTGTNTGSNTGSNTGAGTNAVGNTGGTTNIRCSFVGEFLANPTNPQAFYHCDAGNVARPKLCAGGTQWCQAILTCDYIGAICPSGGSSGNTGGGGGAVVPPVTGGSLVGTACPTLTEYAPNPSDTSTFYYCVPNPMGGNMWVLGSCPTQFPKWCQTTTKRICIGANDAC